MGSICSKLCPPRAEESEQDSEDRALLSEPPSPHFEQANYGSFQPIVDPAIDSPTENEDIVNEIVDAIERRVIDAGANSHIGLDHQEYAERSRYYADHVARCPIGKPPLPMLFPRIMDNLATVMEAPTANRKDLNDMRRLARMNSALLQNVYTTESEKMIVSFQ